MKPPDEEMATMNDLNRAIARALMCFTLGIAFVLFAVGTSSVGIAAYASDMYKHFASTLFAGRLVYVFWLIR